MVHDLEEKIRVEAETAKQEKSSDNDGRDEPCLPPDNEEEKDAKRISLGVRPTCPRTTDIRVHKNRTELFLSLSELPTHQANRSLLEAYGYINHGNYNRKWLPLDN